MDLLQHAKTRITVRENEIKKAKERMQKRFALAETMVDKLLDEGWWSNKDKKLDPKKAKEIQKKGPQGGMNKALGNVLARRSALAAAAGNDYLKPKNKK